MRFLAWVKNKLSSINEEQKLKLDIKLTEKERASLKPNRRCQWPSLEWIRSVAAPGKRDKDKENGELDKESKDLLKGFEDEKLKEEYFGKFTNITKDIKFEVGG